MSNFNTILLFNEQGSLLFCNESNDINEFAQVKNFKELNNIFNNKLPSLKSLTKHKADLLKRTNRKGELYSISLERLCSENNSIYLTILAKENAEAENQWMLDALEYVEQAVWFIDFKERKIRFNQSWLKIHEVESNNLISDLDYWFSFIHPEDKEKVLTKMKNTAILQNQQLMDEYRIITESGKVKWIMMKGCFKKESENNFIASGVYVDISDKVRTQEALRRTDEKLRLLFDNAIDGILHLNSQGIIINVNHAASHITGFPIDELLGLNFRLLFKAKTIFGNLATLSDLENDCIFSDEHEIKRKDGQTIIAAVSVKKLPDFTYQVFLRDVSTQKSLEKEVRLNAQKMEAIFEASTFAILLLDDKERIEDCNAEALKLFGSPSKEAIVGTEFLNYVLPKDIIEIKGYLKNSHSEKRLKKAELRKIDGSAFLAEISFSHIWVPDVHHSSTVISFRDITHEKEIEKEIQKSEFHLRKAQELAKIGSWEWDVETNEIFWSEGMYAILNLEPEKVKPSFKLIADLLFQEDKEGYFESKILNIDANEDAFEIKIKDSKENIKWLRCERSFWFDKARLKKISGTFQDITESKNIEKKVLSSIIQTEEKERKRVAEGLHDDLGPLLSSIKMYLGMLQSEKTTEAEKQDFWKQVNTLIGQAIDSTREIANDLMSSVLIDFGLEEAIKEHVKSLNALKKIQFSVQSNLGKTRFSVEIERIIYRSVKELMNNSLKYSQAKKAEVLIQKKNDKIICRYKDDGVGFDVQEALKKKGMGLKNILNRAKALDGIAQISSAEGEGVNIFLEFNV